MKRFLLWSFERGSIQYDIICILILAFIFFTPATAFNDRPPYMRLLAGDPPIKKTEENRIPVYTVKMDSAALWDDGEHQAIALKALEQFLKVPVSPLKIKPIYTTTGMTVAYAIWIEEVK